MTVEGPRAGWYPAPGEDGLERRWDGTAWTDERREASVRLPPGRLQPSLNDGQKMLLVFGAILVVLILFGLLYPLMVFS